MLCLPVVVRLEGVFPLRELCGEHRDCWPQRARVPGIWRCVLLQDALPVIAVSATPVRRGVAFLMSSGGGKLLAIGYFLAALIRGVREPGGDSFQSIINSSSDLMSPLQGLGDVGGVFHGLAPMVTSCRPGWG